MLAKNLILGLGRKVVVGGRINFPIPDDADLLSQEELEEYIQTNGLETSDPLCGIDLSVPSPADPLASQWPQVVLKSLPQLFREFRVCKSEGGHLSHNIGTQRFSELKSKKGAWTGSRAELALHHQQVKSLNFCLLLHTQESQGIENPEFKVRLKFFNSQQAMEVLQAGRERLRLWSAGKNRPDGNHLVVVLQQQITSSCRYEAFELVVPSPQLSIRQISREGTVTTTGTTAPEALAAVSVPSIEIPEVAAKSAVAVGGMRTIHTPGARFTKVATGPLRVGPAPKVATSEVSRLALFGACAVPSYQMAAFTVRSAMPTRNTVAIGSIHP
jgi:hypothetical protein